MKWFMVVSGAIASGLAPWALSSEWAGTSILLGTYGVLAVTFGIRRFRVEKEIKIKQSGVSANINVGADIRNVPSTGTNLPRIEIEQTNINARENTGLKMDHNPNSGPINMNFTKVEGDFGRVVINPDYGQVVVNPSVGSVKINHWK